MSRKKSTTLYRPFLRDACRLTWQRKSLWIFGIFAALISTGGVVDMVWQSLQKVQRAESLLHSLMNHSFIGYDIAASYMAQLNTLGSQRTSLIVIAATLAGVALLVISILSQGALILGIRSKKPEDPYILRNNAASRFWPLFLVGTLNKILTGIFMLLMTLPLLLISVSSAPAYGALFFVLLVIFIAASIILNIIYIFTLIDIMESDVPVLQAIHTSIRLFLKQWIAAFEYGALLFLLVIGGTCLFVLFLALLLVPYSILFSVIILSGSSALFLTFNILSIFVLIAFVLMFGGACVTFQYSAWYNFYTHGLHKTHGKKVFSKLIRLIHG
ncbi:hypothetical protein HQ487_01650 [Candidatus Uhrbacteria bacterium]|nr:hypothetical protein [Candidatus Uhrbacteria bacterium]